MAKSWKVRVWSAVACLGGSHSWLGRQLFVNIRGEGKPAPERALCVENVASDVTGDELHEVLSQCGMGSAESMNDC